METKQETAKTSYQVQRIDHRGQLLGTEKIGHNQDGSFRARRTAQIAAKKLRDNKRKFHKAFMIDWKVIGEDGQQGEP